MPQSSQSIRPQSVRPVPPVSAGPTRWQLFTARLPPTSRAKDINAYPFFRGGISRGAWRFYMYRLTPVCGWFLTLTLLFFMFGYNTLDLQAYIPFAYALGIWCVTICCALVFKPRVTLKVQHASRLRAGEILQVEVEVRQQKQMLGATMTLVPHRLPPALDMTPEEGTQIPALGRGQTVHVRLGIRCTQRGLYHWQGFRVECNFPFGLLRSYRPYIQQHDVLVYPSFTRLTRLQIPTSLRYQPGGVVFASTIGESLEYIGNREYREGDNIRDIDWRATARLNLPIVREYREEYFLRVGVVLDTHLPTSHNGKPMKYREREAQQENFERAVSLTAAVSDYMARSDYIVDLFAAGPNLFHLTSGRSLAYLDQILDILACVEGSAAEPFDILEPEIVENLAQITTIVCIFMDWNAARQAFVRRLQREGTAIKAIVVRDSACTLEPDAADIPGGLIVLTSVIMQSGVEEL